MQSKATDEEFRRELDADFRRIASMIAEGETEAPQQVFARCREKIGVATIDKVIAKAEEVEAVLEVARPREYVPSPEARRATLQFLNALRDGDYEAAALAIRSAE